MSSVHVLQRPVHMDRDLAPSPRTGRGDSDSDADFDIGEGAGSEEPGAVIQGPQERVCIGESESDERGHEDGENAPADVSPSGGNLVDDMNGAKCGPANPLVQVMESWSGISRALSAPEDDGGVLPAGEGASWRPAEAVAEAPVAGTAKDEAGRMVPLQMAAEGPDALAGNLQERHQQVAALAEPEAPPMPGRLSPQTGATALHQLAEALVRTRGNRLEIALSPEELGRLRLVLSRENGASHIQVWAERPEVLDLIRRNSDLLLEHFGDRDAAQPSLSFSNEAPEDEPAARSADREAEPPGSEATVLAAVQAAGFNRLSAEHRVDIRV